MSAVLDDYVAFLDATLPADYDTAYSTYREDASLRAAFQRAAFDAGWLVPEWAPELGGRDLPLPEALAVRIAGAQRRIPRLMNIQGVGVVAPALRAFGTDAQRERLLEPVLRGDEWWALGMSEPEAGSDLASMRTTARLDGDEFVVNGQKTWTTQADESRWCTLYARTDPAEPRHRGISCLILDLRSPGVTVRPIRTAGSAVESFCEVFLEDVRVPAANLLGELHGGWRVAMASLEHERDMIWINNWMEAGRALAPALAVDDPGDDLLVDAGRRIADAEAVRFTGLRTFAGRLAGLPTPEFTILKLLGSETVQAAARLSLTAAGSGARTRPALFDEHLESLGATIYGGTSEIQRDIIGEQALGLPRGR